MGDIVLQAFSDHIPTAQDMNEGAFGSHWRNYSQD